MNSFEEFLPCPSAMLDGIDTTALLSWSDNAYVSSLGNSFAILYTQTVKSMAFCHTFNCL